jgi:hypothetical protein
MAVVNRKDADKAPERKKINPFDKGLESGVEVEINQDADAWASVAPPKGGKPIYRVKLFVPQNTGYDMGYRDEDNQKEPYYNANLECKILDGEFKDYTIYADVSTRIGRGKEISTAMALMRLAGKDVPKKVTDSLQIKMFAEWIKSEPILWLRGDWAAWSKVARRNIFTKMEDFPLAADGSTHEHIVNWKTDNGTTEEIIGRFKVKKWFSKQEAKEEGWTVDGMKDGGKATVVAKPATSDDDDDEETPKPIKTGKAGKGEETASNVKTGKKPAPKNDVVDDDDDDDDED